MNGPQITLIGRLTRDPGELRYTANEGTAYTRAGVAVNTFKNRGTEQETTFFNVTLWGSHAENLMNRSRKGNQIYIQGTYSFREYTRADGGRGYSHDVNARDFHQFMDANSNQPAGDAETATAEADPPWNEASEAASEEGMTEVEAGVTETEEEAPFREEAAEAGDPFASGN